jgi:hypothetical protein
LGKTNLALAIAMAINAGRDFAVLSGWMASSIDTTIAR